MIFSAIILTDLKISFSTIIDLILSKKKTMTTSAPNRLDRIEALVESNATVAKAQANLAQAQADTKREMDRMMGNFEQMMEKFEQHNQGLSRRQGEIVEIIKTLANQSKNSS